MKSRWVVAGAIAFCFACMWALLGAKVVGFSVRQDFLNLYTGGTLAAEGQYARLHDKGLQLERETALGPPRDGLVPFTRPHFYAFLLSPLSGLALEPAFSVWLLLHAALLVAAWIWAARRWGPDALLLGSMYLPAALGIAHGQDGVFLLWIAIAGYLLAERESDLGAGAVLALGLFKWHLLLLLPVGMVLQRRWRMFAGYCAVAVSLVAFSLVSGGLAGVDGYLRLIFGERQGGTVSEPWQWICLHGLIANWGEFPLAALLAAASGVFLSAWAIYRGDRREFWVIGIAGSLFLAPHVYGYDAAVLLLPLLLVFFGEWSGMSRAAAGVLLAPIVCFLGILDPPWAGMPAAALGLFWAAALTESLCRGQVFRFRGTEPEPTCFGGRGISSK